MKAILCVLFALAALSSAQFCLPCQEVVALIENYATSNATEDKILAQLESLCTLLPQGYQQQCMQAIAENGPAIIQMIIKQEDPATVCAQLQLCTSKVTSKPSPRLPVHRVKTQDDPVCQECALLVRAIEDYVNLQGLTPEEIQTLLDNYVCPYFSIPSDQCQEVSAEVEIIVQLLQKRTDPATICNQIGACTSALIKLTKSRDVGCSACEFAINEVESYVKSGKTEGEIEKKLNQLCAVLPGSFHDGCTKLVAQLPAIISMLEAHETPLKVCSDLKVCNSPRLGVHH